MVESVGRTYWLGASDKIQVVLRSDISGFGLHFGAEGPVVYVTANHLRSLQELINEHVNPTASKQTSPPPAPAKQGASKKG